MGKIFSAIFGGSGSSNQSQQSSKQDSWNNAWPFLSHALIPTIGYGLNGQSLMSQLLGGDSTGFNNYKKATGFDFADDQGTQSILTNLRAQGLGDSGPALKALTNYKLGLQDQFANDYFNHATGLGQLGLGAANVMSDAGRQSSGTSQGSSSGSSWDFGKGLLSRIPGMPS